MGKGFVVAVNGMHVAGIPCEGSNVVSVRLHGDDRGDELAALDASCGLYSGDGEGRHLIMINDHQIQAGDIVSIAFDAHLVDPSTGQTIEQLFPAKLRNDESSAPRMEDLFDEIAALPKRREAFTVEILAPKAQQACFKTRPGDYGFSAMVLWSAHKENVARVSISSHTLEEVRDGAPGWRHARFAFAEGDSIALRIGT